LLLSSLSWAQQNSFLSFLFHTFNNLYARRVQSVCRLVVLFFPLACVCQQWPSTQQYSFYSSSFFLSSANIHYNPEEKKKSYNLNLGLSAFFLFFSHLSTNSHRLFCNLSTTIMRPKQPKFMFSLYRSVSLSLFLYSEKENNY